MDAEFDSLPDRDALLEAAALVRKTLPPTPEICWPLLCERTGAEVWVKHENHLPVGAFKVRGGLIYLHHLARDPAARSGLISATRGNHGQSLAFAARPHGLHVTVVVPHGNSREKNAAMRALGAELVEHGTDFSDADAHASRLAEERHLVRVPSFHPLLIRGVASYWLELFQAVPDLDTVYVPVGLGSGICAGIAVRDALGLQTRLVGVVASSAPAYARSFAQGAPVSHPVRRTIADGVACREPHPQALRWIQAGVERIVEVGEPAIRQAMRALFVDTHNVAEGAAAAPLAALEQERERMRGRKVGLILTGGNVDHEVFAQVLAETETRPKLDTAPGSPA